jgi:hypothetical protein
VDDGAVCGNGCMIDCNICWYVGGEIGSVVEGGLFEVSVRRWKGG